MLKKSKVMLLGVITALILALPLAAQSYDNAVLGSAPALSSNTKTATATIFSTDVDNFINYHKYSGVKFDNWFGFITGEPYTVGTNTTTGKLKAGYARNVGSLYLGIFFQGNMFQNTSNPNNDKTVTLTPTYDNASQTLTETKQETSYNEGWLNSTNQIEFLIGVAGQGIKLGFVESLYSNEHESSSSRNETITDHQNGRVDYQNVSDEYTKSGGTLKPYLGWGTNIPVSGMNLMPYIDVSMDIFNETLIDKYRNYTEFNGIAQDVSTSLGAGKNTGYLRPVGTVGAKLDLAKKETVQTTLEVRYKIDTQVYNSDYEATGLSGDTVNGEVSWDSGYVNRTTRYIDHTQTATSLKLTIEEKTNISHTGTFIYKVTGEPAEGFRLGFSAGLPVSYFSGSETQYKDTYSTTNIKYNNGLSRNTTSLTHTYVDGTYYGWSGEYSTLIAALRLNVGASYKVIPDRFTVNAGIIAIPTVFSHEETTEHPRSIDSITQSKTTDESGDVTDSVSVVRGGGGSDSVKYSNTWDGYRGTLYGVFVFYFTPAAALDLGLTANTNSFNVDLANVNVLFSVKF